MEPTPQQLETLCSYYRYEYDMGASTMRTSSVMHRDATVERMMRLVASSFATFEEALHAAKRVPRTFLGTFRFDIRTNEWEMV